MEMDLLHPSTKIECTKHKLKRLIQEPNSFFMDVRCKGCMSISTIFSHAQTAIKCSKCQSVLARPTGGKAKIVAGNAWRAKEDKAL